MNHPFSSMVMLTMTLFGCSRPETSHDIDKDIILLNGGRASRKELAHAIVQLNTCNPKIIAINFLFPELQDASSDSVLVEAMRSRNNVVLLSVLASDSIRHSNKVFTSAALDDGVMIYQLSDELVTDYVPFKSVNTTVEWSFPFTILAHFDPTRGFTMMSATKPDEFYPINFKRTIENYTVIDIGHLNELDCSMIENKLVLVGYLGPETEDTFVTPLNKSQTYNTVIIANIISNLLEEHPATEAQPSK